MLVLDQMIQDEYQSPPVVMLAEAKSSPSGSVPKTGICVISPTYDQIQASYNKQGRSINPDLDAEDHFVPPDNPHMFGMTAEFMEGVDGEINSTVKVLEAPKHGKLETYRGEKGAVDFKKSVSYVPNPGYVGKDRITVLVTGNKGRSIVLSYYLNVTPAAARKDLYESGAYKKYCPNGQLIWKISSDSPQAPIDLASLPRDVTLTALIADASQALTGFTNLPGSAIGQTTGTNITLDTNAAGYNWFINPTPADNSEFLPTSNPDVWIAKAGTEAAGKMDLLSVLLHEYGHTLGIEHSADSNDYMAATLQPGVRRLPSSDELALMAQLVGEIKTAQDSTPNTPINPSLPIGTTLSALFLGRLRRTGYGSWSPVFDSVQIPAPATQTRLNQVFESKGVTAS